MTYIKVPSPLWESTSSPRREGAGPPSALGVEGGLVYGSRGTGSGPTGLGMGDIMGPPEGAGVRWWGADGRGDGEMRGRRGGGREGRRG